MSARRAVPAWHLNEEALRRPKGEGKTTPVDALFGAPNSVGGSVKIDVETGNFAPRVAEAPFPGEQPYFIVISAVRSTTTQRAQRKDRVFESFHSSPIGWSVKNT